MYYGIDIGFRMVHSMLKHGFNPQHPTIVQLKKDTRKYLHKLDQEENGLIVKCIHEDDYGYANLKAYLPVSIVTKEQAEEYFMDHLYRVCYPSQYDCTGQHFTLWHKLTRQNGRWVAYYREGMDV